jgi:hypothetical protein
MGRWLLVWRLLQAEQLARLCDLRDFLMDAASVMAEPIASQFCRMGYRYDGRIARWLGELDEHQWRLWFNGDSPSVGKCIAKRHDFRSVDL